MPGVYSSRDYYYGFHEKYNMGEITPITFEDQYKISYFYTRSSKTYLRISGVSELYGSTYYMGFTDTHVTFKATINYYDESTFSGYQFFTSDNVGVPIKIWLSLQAPPWL